MYFGVKNITVNYGKKVVIDNLSLEIEQGTTTAIIGQNGSGKSTLLKAMGRLMPFKGQVIYKDQSLLTMPTREVAKRIALLPQSPKVPEGITVLELVSLGRFPHQKLTQQSLSKDDYDFVRRVMMETKVWDLRAEEMASLSGGQRQRVWITMILAQDTDIILLDEPTTYLDIVHQLDFLTMLKIFARKMNKTVIYVIHELNQVARFADNIVAIKDGTLVENGPVDQVFTEDNIKRIFDIEVTIGLDEFSGSRMITGVKNA
jgi:iron complex transport system ATP-binding protein